MLSVEQLKAIKISNPEIFKRDFGYENNLTGYDLLHGHCADVSIWMARELSYMNPRIERVYVDPGNGKKPDSFTPFAHQYCVVTHNRREIYIDIRGLSFDKDEFLQEFVEYEKKKLGVDVIHWQTETVDMDPAQAFKTLCEVKPGEDSFDVQYLMNEMYKADSEYHNSFYEDFRAWYTWADSKFDIDFCLRQMKTHKERLSSRPLIDTSMLQNDDEDSLEK